MPPIDTTQLAGQISNYENLGAGIIQALMDLYGAGMSEYQKLHAQAVAAGINPAAIQAALVKTVAKLQADFAASGADADPLGLIDQSGNVIPITTTTTPPAPTPPAATPSFTTAYATQQAAEDARTLLAPPDNDPGRTGVFRHDDGTYWLVTTQGAPGPFLGTKVG
jgi:hypothetical protein